MPTAAPLATSTPANAAPLARVSPPLAAPRAPSSPPLAVRAPTPIATFDLRLLQPTFGPLMPKAGPVGILVVVLAYFSLGVAVGALLKPSPRARRWLPVLVAPGLLAALAFAAWVIRTLL